ncbi:uncharacterized protein [Diadema setosum]|uniref:uncharacterized protein n=1 Tax=Diadema setosum TaxID=31175 RepID=UPI003B3B0E90
MICIVFMLLTLLMLCFPGCVLNICWRRPRQQQERLGEEVEELITRPPTLTKGQVQQCKDELKSYYRLSQRKVSVDPLNFMERVELDEIYTNLSLIDRSSMHKTPITYSDLLTSDRNSQLSKHLLVQGEGGVGKTTLCAKIAWDWSQGRILQDLDMLLLIPLRHVTNEKSIGSIVKRYLSDLNAVTTKEIEYYISTNPSKVLFVLDGFDEFKWKLSEKKSSAIIRILGLTQHKSCKVIVTTRPWRTNEFMEEKNLAEAYTLLSVEGFNKENLSTYIRKYYRATEKDVLAENLISFIEENNVIRSYMAPFPIYCTMICLMWNNVSEMRRKEMQKLQTFSKVFGEMISFLKEHYASKVCENLQNRNVVKHFNNASKAIEDISSIALKGLLDKKLSFPEEQFRVCRDAMETCCRVGVLTIDRDVISRERRRKVLIPSFVVSVVSFPHKLFQEYVAGLYIDSLFTSDPSEYNKLKRTILNRCEEFRYLLYFTSALRNELGLDIINGMIECADRGRDFCVDVAFECYTEDATTAVGKRWKEYRLFSDTSEHTKSGVVLMMHRDQVQSLSIDNANCGRTVSRGLAEGMCSSSVLREVSVSYSQFHADFFKILSKKAWNCKIQDLKLAFNSWDEDLQNQSSIGRDLAEWVCSLPHLSSFSVTCYYLPDNFLSTTASLASSCQIQDLQLYFEDWNDDSPQQFWREDLARWVCTLPRLSSFSVLCPYLSDKFFSTAAILASSCQVLKISRNIMIKNLKLTFDITEDDFQRQSSLGKDLAKWICTMPSLSSFCVECPYLPAGFFSTAIDLAQVCQLESITVNGTPVNELVSP